MTLRCRSSFVVPLAKCYLSRQKATVCRTKPEQIRAGPPRYLGGYVGLRAPWQFRTLPSLPHIQTGSASFRSMIQETAVGMYREPREPRENKIPKGDSSAAKSFTHWVSAGFSSSPGPFAYLAWFAVSIAGFRVGLRFRGAEFLFTVVSLLCLHALLLASSIRHGGLPARAF